MKIANLPRLVKLVGLAAAAFIIPATLHAAVVVTMTANDAFGTTSFNTAGTWSDALAPSAGSAYSTVGYLLRSPTSAGTYTFAGDSLTVGGGSGGATFSTVSGNNNSLIFKASGVDLVVNNLILDGSQIRDGNGDGQWAQLDGNISITANGGAFMAQDTNIINSAISGSGPLYIGDNGNGGADRVVLFTSGSSLYNGNILFNNTHSSADYSRATWTDGSILNFDIGANGVNNNISGQGTATFNGDFNFNLTGASATIGDSWDIVDATTTAGYGSTFAVNSFVDMGGGYWASTASGPAYQFNANNGVLSYVAQAVPEPGSVMMLLSGLGMFLGINRFRKV